MLTYDEAFERIQNTVNAQSMAARAMFHEYRTTGEMSVPRATEIVRLFVQRGAEIENQRGTPAFREPNTAVHLLHNLAQLGAEGMFGPKGLYRYFEDTPGADADRAEREVN